LDDRAMSGGTPCKPITRFPADFQVVAPGDAANKFVPFF